MDQFLLRRGKAAGPTGVGANGAGGTGGPLVSGVSDYLLEGNAAELRRHANEEVRVTARIDARTTAADTFAPRTDAAPDAASTAQRGAPSGQGTATTGTVSNPRVLTVETVERLASECPES